MRGEFVRGDGLVIPNNITQAGVAALLASAFANAALDLYMGLVQASPDSQLQLADVLEPTIGVNGYTRQSLAKGAVNWPTAAALNGEPYVESKALVFAATGSGFSKSIQRLMLCFSQNAVAGSVFSLSAPLPNAMTILSTTPLDQRTFKYRLFGR